MKEAIYINDKSKRVIILEHEPEIEHGPELRLIGVNRNFKTREELLRIANFLSARYNCTFDQKAQEDYWDHYDEIALAIYENQNRY